LPVFIDPRQIKATNERFLPRLKLGILSPYVDMTPFDKIGEHVLDFGIGRGANPFTCAANYLEKLARRLPP
jgi:hypothetical protein